MSRRRAAAVASSVIALAASAAAHGATGRPVTVEDLEALRAHVEQQQRLIDEQQKALQEQRSRIQDLEVRMGYPDPRYLLSSERMRETRGGAAPPASVAQQTDQERVGEPPPEDSRPPQVEVISERGGALTRRGTLVLEPAIEYSHSSVNRFNFRGVSVAEAILIGIIEATDADRDSVVGSMTARYGVTNRFEIEAKAPYVYRQDRVTNTVQGTAGTFSLTDELTGKGLGDLEIAAHYQLNRGRDGWPFLVGNLRFKSDTGKGPFEVERDTFGIEEELATGSGFKAIEPSLTAIYPLDPAVLFANLGYTYNIAENIDKNIAGLTIGRVKPGDSISASFGIGVALNPVLSMSFAYKHDFIRGTTTEINGNDRKSNEQQVGSLAFGIAWALNERVNLNLTSEIGATSDAPDARILFRVPVKFNVLD